MNTNINLHDVESLSISKIRKIPRENGTFFYTKTIETVDDKGHKTVICLFTEQKHHLKAK